MTTECNGGDGLFNDVAGREVVARFDGGRVTSDGGVLLLREVDTRLGLTSRLARCFRDHRRQDLIEHELSAILAQRIFGLCLGYEDVSDHDELCKDPLLAAACGRSDIEGRERERKADAGKALAGKSTLSRLEMTPRGASAKSRYAKVEMDQEAVDQLFADVFMESFDAAPALVTLDVDATDVPLHGAQEGRFFHGYYGSYCYLPLYIFSEEHLLVARLRTADGDPAAGVREELARLVARLRARWPKVKILLRGDSGFCREELMRWCEDEGHFYVLGLARNPRLVAEIAGDLARAKVLSEERKEAVRFFRDFTYATIDTWSRHRRVVGKAEHLVGDKSNPRFVVTNLPKSSWGPRRLYEQLYCARGDMENRIKEQQLGLFADRLSTPTLQGNRVRVMLSSMAYVLMHGLRRLGLAGTDLARAQASTIRTKLLKIGAVVRVSVRRLWVSMSSAFPAKEVFLAAAANVRAHAPPSE